MTENFTVIHFYFFILATLSEDELKEKDDLAENALSTTKDCWNEADGGWGGNIGHFAHTAPTYAAVLSLLLLGTDAAYEYLLSKKTSVYRFFMNCKDTESGGFRVQLDGEIDTRGLYTVLCVADIMNIWDENLTKGCFEFIVRCQTYEGGFGGEPFNEAHGGYSFCALAALCLLRKHNTISEENIRQNINLELLRHWVVNRQLSIEGGFQGRTNKLVDSCYSFWQGAIPVMHEKLTKNSFAYEDPTIDYVDPLPLIRYVILCCQDLNGGFKDKPGKNRDQYHTSYAMSGLSVAEHYYRESKDTKTNSFLSRTSVLYGVSVDKMKNYQRYLEARK